MDKMKILVVDDESRMRKLVSDFLTRKGYAVIEAADGVEAVDTFMENKDIALIILDVMMPRMDGWEVCRQIRKDSKVPIIMLTAKGEEMDELQGFECGADEYIAKPFSPKILTARVDAIIRRAYGVDSNEIIEIGGITIDKAAHIVKIDGEEIELSYKEFELLTYFMENAPAAQNDRAQIRVIEPYCYGQFTEGKASPNFGRSHVHWLTGTASTVMVGCVEGILGMRPDFYGLHLTPAIPHEWEEFEVNKVFRGCQLHIVVKNPGHVQSGCDRLLVNGVRMQGDYIPQEVLKKQTEIVLYMS